MSELRITLWQMALKGSASEEMALILYTFDIEDRDIFVIPWQNPISSYMVTDNMVKDLVHR